jgi:hypothetical protein
LVAIESNPELATKKQNKHNKGSKVGFLKMIVMDDLSATGIEYEVKKGIDSEAKVHTDGYRSYSGLKNIVKEHKVTIVVDKTETSKTFPWVHTAISNAKKLLLGTWHRIDDKYLQNYLNEFCYRHNRRYLGEHVFDRLLIASVSYTAYGYSKG